MTGKRHDFRIDYDVGFDDAGPHPRHRASTRGALRLFRRPVRRRSPTAPCSTPTTPTPSSTCAIRSQRCKTHTVSNTAFRGFGGPQGMIGDRAGDRRDRARARARSARRAAGQFLSAMAPRNVTPYHMEVEDNVIAEIVDELEDIIRLSRTAAGDRRSGTRQNPVLKKGIALTPVKFGISFTTTHLNQAGALVHVYTDGSVHLNHGGTEMGQGLFVKVAQVVAEEFQIDLDRVKITRDQHRQGAEHLGDRRLVRLRPERHGGAGGGAQRSSGRLIAFAAREIQGAGGAGRVPAEPRAHRQPGDAVRRPGAAGLSRPRVALAPPASTRTPEDPLRPRDGERAAVLLFRLWRGGERGGDRHADRREPAAARRHPARRRARR